jgi:hypothetical protein
LPFASEKQRRYLHANEPEMAKRWEEEEKRSKGERNPLRKRALRGKRSKKR